ncbi:MAG TPA: DUF4388 domain-containing protein [Thermoanaerobaculia bacterium]|nr:DUF4388 domain-containing protein [Thermoanaerobaculia bacterium]
MSDDLSIQGTLAETTVPDLFRSMIRSGELGTLTLEPQEEQCAVYFAGGKIVFASSSDPDFRLPEILLRSGELSIEQYTEVEEKAYGSRRVGAVLCDLGYLQPDELTHALERQATMILMRVLPMRRGAYTLEFQSELPREILHLKLNTERVVLDGVNRIDYWSLVSKGIGRRSRLLRHAREADARIFHLDMTEEESYIYSALSDALTVGELCERSYLSNFVTCRTAWALLAANLLEDAEESEVGRERAAAQSELELESAVERYNSAFQSLFNAVFQRIGDHIYDFVDRVVLNLSAETLPLLSGVNLLNEGRVDFDQLLNNLISSGWGGQDVVVRRALDELLEGWIREMRREFGASCENDVAKAVSSLR